MEENSKILENEGPFLNGSNQNQKHFAAIIRHGEPGDEVQNFKYTNLFDPPLTPLGMRQAGETADFLDGYFKKEDYKFDEIVIESSPYLKCMMTAA